VQAVEPHAVAGHQKAALGIAAGKVDHASVSTDAPARVNDPASILRRAQPGRSRTTVRWVPRSSTASRLAMGAVITSPAFRVGGTALLAGEEDPPLQRRGQEQITHLGHDRRGRLEGGAAGRAGEEQIARIQPLEAGQRG
jgi:hypothetical protein